MAFSPAHRLLARVGTTPTYKKIWKYWYPLMTRRLGDDEVVFINWAYEEDPPMALPLEASDEPNRAHINLYHRTATQADLSGKRVLEVSCGHGGGASYLKRNVWRSVAATAAEPRTSCAPCSRPPIRRWT